MVDIQVGGSMLFKNCLMETLAHAHPRESGKALMIPSVAYCTQLLIDKGARELVVEVLMDCMMNATRQVWDARAGPIGEDGKPKGGWVESPNHDLRGKIGLDLLRHFDGKPPTVHETRKVSLSHQHQTKGPPEGKLGGKGEGLAMAVRVQELMSKGVKPTLEDVLPPDQGDKADVTRA